LKPIIDLKNEKENSSNAKGYKNKVRLRFKIHDKKWHWHNEDTREACRFAMSSKVFIIFLDQHSSHFI
jgi:hypothetical protein